LIRAKTMVGIDDVRAIALDLPRSYEAEVRGGLRFRVGRIVYLGFGANQSIMGFAFPKEERDALVVSRPDTFLLPAAAQQRYHWAAVRLDALDITELREIIIEAWTMAVPKGVAAAYLDLNG
jgi:hypothetical protein